MSSLWITEVIRLSPLHLRSLEVMRLGPLHLMILNSMAWMNICEMGCHCLVEPCTWICPSSVMYHGSTERLHCVYFDLFLLFRMVQTAYGGSKQKVGQALMGNGPNPLFRSWQHYAAQMIYCPFGPVKKDVFFSTSHWLSAWSPKEMSMQSKNLYRASVRTSCSTHRQMGSYRGQHNKQRTPPGKSAVESPRAGFCSKRQKTNQPATSKKENSNQQTNQTSQTAAGKKTKLVATIYIRAYTQSPLTSSASASASASSSLREPLYPVVP